MIQVSQRRTSDFYRVRSSAFALFLALAGLTGTPLSRGEEMRASSNDIDSVVSGNTLPIFEGRSHFP